MAKRLNLYQTSEELNADKQNLPEPSISYVRGSDEVYMHDYEKYLKLHSIAFTALEDNCSVGLTKLSTKQTLEYSTDATTWNTFNTTTNISLNNGDKMYVRGMLSADNTSSNYTQFKMTGKIAASGNCNTIWNYQDLNAPLKKYCGYRTFRDCVSLTIAPKLPATTLAPYCYYAMFYDCQSLTATPELPATTLATQCYYTMFKGCTSLTAAPKLPATTLAKECYMSMLSGCTSLTTAPVLPATTLAESCYCYMFGSCTNLTTAPELPATMLADYCYGGMFIRCTSLTTAPKLPVTVLANRCYGDMFNGCTSLSIAPELPATALTDRCYEDMFFGCTNLNYIKCLATDITASGCIYSWVSGVGSAGTFVKHPDMHDWDTGSNGIPEGWTVEDAERYNEIWYTSNDENVVTPYATDVFGANIVSNTYEDGKGVIKFDNSVTSIGSYAFYYCTSLTSITIPNSVTSIGNKAFMHSSLASLTIPNSVTNIGGQAFLYCSLTVPVYNAQYFAYMPTSYSGAYTIPEGIKQIAGSAFSGCSKLTSITIPNSVTSIGGGAFKGCSSLTSVTIPNSVTSIGDGAFGSCYKLTSIIIPDSVTSIGGGAFQYCTSLSSITIPDSVTEIREETFYGCSSLTSITCLATTPPSLGSSNNLSNVTAVYVPADSVEAYKTATEWSYYASKIQPISDNTEQ